MGIVEARYGGKSEYYPGKISRVNADGTLDILYDDGDTERRVRASLIRPLVISDDVGTASAENGDLKRGDIVEARYGGKAKYYPGKISRVNADGTFDILYDDGDTER